MDFRYTQKILALSALVMALAACAPFSDTNPHTGNIAGPLVGGAVGVGIGGLLHLSHPATGALGVGGAGLGYYLTTLRFSSAEIVQAGGQVFSQGQFLTINLPTDTLFEENAADFLPGTEPILKSITSVLARYPDSNIIVSGNMSGFASNRFERKLSEARARQIASYLWMQGINSFNHQGIRMDRKLLYIGYGDYFPIANHYTLEGLRANSRIQITAAPTDASLHLDKCHEFGSNVGSVGQATPRNAGDFNNAFSDSHLPSDEGKVDPFGNPILGSADNIAVINDSDSADFK